VYARCTRGATWKSWLKLAGRFGAPNFLIDFIRSLPSPVAMMPRDLFSVLSLAARREESHPSVERSRAAVYRVSAVIWTERQARFS